MATFIIEKCQIVHIYRACRILISTDVSGMGTDVAGLNLVINLGLSGYQ